MVVVGCLAVAGCGGGEEQGVRIEWDLSGRHTLDEVTWPKDRLDSYTTQLKPLELVSIRLPAGEVLRMPDRAESIILYRRSNGPELVPGPEGRILDKVEVYSDPMTVEDAYRRALGYADQFDLPRVPFEAWRERRDQGVDPETDRTATTAVNDRRLGGKGGPIPTVELLYSFNDERPWVVMVVAYWPPPRG